MGTGVRRAPRHGVQPAQAHGGGLCGCAVQFLRDGETFDSAGDFVPLDDGEIAAHLRVLRRDDSAWDFEETGGRWSLGGQQGKFALARGVDGGWVLPTGRAPSTHIFAQVIDEAGAAISAPVRKQFKDGIAGLNRSLKPV